MIIFNGNFARSFIDFVMRCNCRSNYARTLIDKISELLTTKNKDVINQLSITDSNKVLNIGEDRVYMPVFECKNLFMYIGFDGSQLDSVSDIPQNEETPYSICPFDGTTLKFNNGFSFYIGDDINKFKEVFGDGEYEEYGNLQADKQVYHLKYVIEDIKVEFFSYDINFANYSMEFFKN